MEDKLETNQVAQEELKNKVDSTAAALEEVKTTMIGGKLAKEFWLIYKLFADVGSRITEPIQSQCFL